MKNKRVADHDFEDSDSFSDAEDSDEELQEAFAKGLLKPGLSEVIERERKNVVNNVSAMRARLDEMKLKLPWIERLDLVTSVAPMAPEIALHMQETASRRKNLKENTKGNQVYNPAEDPVLNEFKRENLLHRQAQAAVIEGIKKLKELGVKTKRPDDFFAEMAKSDDHMQKVRRHLVAKQEGQARAEKVRQLRDAKKIAKKVQTEVKLKQAADKKELLDKLKKVRKGKSDDLDFLDDDKSKKGTTAKKTINKKRIMRDKKFGFGGKKKGSKLNTRESSNQIDGFNSSKVQKLRGKSLDTSGKKFLHSGKNFQGKSNNFKNSFQGGGKNFKKMPSNAKGSKKQRPGKSRRLKSKSKK